MSDPPPGDAELLSKSLPIPATPPGEMDGGLRGGGAEHGLGGGAEHGLALGKGGGGAYKHGGLPLIECTKNFPNPLPLFPAAFKCLIVMPPLLLQSLTQNQRLN